MLLMLNVIVIVRVVIGVVIVIGVYAVAEWEHYCCHDCVERVVSIDYDTLSLPVIEVALDNG